MKMFLEKDVFDLCCLVENVNLEKGLLGGYIIRDGAKTLS